MQKKKNEVTHARGHRPTSVNIGLFTWREEDPSARKILEGGSSERHKFSLFSLHAKGCTWS